jgi:hypothetical protein
MAPTRHTDTGGRPPAAVAVGTLAALGLIGSSVMTLAHLGLDIPVLDTLGAGVLVVPAAVSFAVGTLLYAGVAYGALRTRRWTWVAGLVVNVLAFITAAFPVRSWVSVAAIVVSVTTIAVLLSPPGRAAFR